MGDKLLGRRINAARKDRGITSERLSELCNINDTYMRQIESGAKIPSLPVFVTICKELYGYRRATCLPMCWRGLALPI